MHPLSFAFEAIGTHWEIDLFTELASERFAVVKQRVAERIDLFDQAYSRFRSDSLVMRMARAAGTYALPADAKPMFDLYQKLYGLTGGVFTPLIGRTLEDAGYDATYSLKSAATIRAPQRWEDALDYQFPNLIVKEPALLDFGAAGKGYLVDLVGEVLVTEGVDAFLINAGGDILHRGSEPVRIGLEDPEQLGMVIGVATIQNQSICGSAGNRRAWGTFHHTIDPRTLTSPTHLLSTWAIADSALLADALTTCLYLLPTDALAQAFRFHYAVMDANRGVQMSPDAPIELFTA